MNLNLQSIFPYFNFESYNVVFIFIIFFCPDNSFFNSSEYEVISVYSSIPGLNLASPNCHQFKIVVINSFSLSYS